MTRSPNANKRPGARPPAAGFTCGHCGAAVSAEARGTRHRNHCPRCLWSVHLDRQPGDRSSGCGGPLEPIGIEVKRNGEWALIHRCGRCGGVRVNRTAGDDDELALLRLALRPLTLLPFPIDPETLGRARRGRG